MLHSASTSIGMAGLEQPAPSAQRPPLPRRRPRRESDLYYPPFRRRRLDAAQGSKAITDTVLQTTNWTRMKKHINGVINCVNQHNVAHCALDLFRVNIVRGRGVLCKALMRAQLASPSLSPVFATLVAIVGSRMPFLAELLIRRLVAQLKHAYSKQDRVLCHATVRFIAQLFNQQVVNEILLLEFLSTCMLDPSDSSVELAVVTLNECAVLLMEKSPKALELVFQRIRELLHDGGLSRRAQVMIENLMNLRRTKFANADVVPPHLDLLEEEDVITHFVSLEDEFDFDLQYDSDGYQFDPQYDANEKEYEEIKRDILGAAIRRPPPDDVPLDKEIENIETEAVRDTSTKMNEDGKKVAERPTDMTEEDLVDFQRTVYLLLSSGLTYEEWAHKLMRLIRGKKGKEVQLCKMILECCSQEKTYIPSYGLLGQRFCRTNKLYRTIFEDLFATHYATVHNLDIRKNRNIASFFASLLASDVLSWALFQVVRIVEEETTASSRIFLQDLFQELWRTLGEAKTKERFEQAESEGHLDGVFPTDKAENARFSINFFSKIGLEFLTTGWREKLKAITESDANARRGEDSDSSVLSSESEEPLELSDSGEEENEIDQVGDPLRSKQGMEKPFTPERQKPSRKDLTATETDGDRRRGAALEGREVSVRGRPHTSSFQDCDTGSPYADVENNQAVYVNASSTSGAKRVAQRRTDGSDDSYAGSGRRDYTSQRRSAYGHDKKRRRYESSYDEEEYRREKDVRYSERGGSVERGSKYRDSERSRRYDQERRFSRSPTRSHGIRNRSPSPRVRPYRHSNRQERSDSDYSGGKYGDDDPQRRRDVHRSRKRRGYSSEASDEEPSYVRSSSRDGRRNYRRYRRSSQSASLYSSDDEARRDKGSRTERYSIAQGRDVAR